MNIILIAVFVIVFTWWFIKGCRKPLHFPPGPPKWPLLGSLPHLAGAGDAPGGFFHMGRLMVRRYGKLAGFYHGNIPTVVVSDFDIIKDLLKREDVSARGNTLPFHRARPGSTRYSTTDSGVLGILFSQGKMWQDQRRFALKNLRDLGFGKTDMEGAITREAVKLCRQFDRLSGSDRRPLDITATMNMSVLNALWAIIVGETLEPNDPKLIQFVQLVSDYIRNTNPFHPLVTTLPYPSLVQFPVLWKLANFDLGEKVIIELAGLMRSYFVEHVKTIDAESPRDFLDMYILHIQSTQDPASR